jgi:hypothetical protein
METKLIAKMGLLTGTTWVVNTLVINAVMVMILLATMATAKGWMRSMPVMFAGLFLGLSADWALRFNSLVVSRNSAVNLVFVTVLLAVPVLFAAVIYARLFEKTPAPSFALGWNLFGGMVGGLLEYTSTAIGTNNLNLLCVGAYAAVALLVYRDEIRLPRATISRAAGQ